MNVKYIGKVVQDTLLLKGRQTPCKSNLIYHQGVKRGRNERESEKKVASLVWNWYDNCVLKSSSSRVLRTSHASNVSWGMVNDDTEGRSTVFKPGQKAL